MAKRLPTEPGSYYWTEWKCMVQVEARGKNLVVTPPGGVQVRVTPRIAGEFRHSPRKPL